jgi:hypothetical protein
MFNRNALKSFAVGMLAAIIVAVGVWPVLAHDGGQLLPANRGLAPQAGWMPGDSPGGEELDRPAGDEITGQGFPATSPIVIPAAAFTNTGTDPDGFWFNGSGGYVDGWDSACLKTAVYLPNGATVDSVWATVYDNDAVDNVVIYLRRVYYLNPATVDTMATVSTAGTNPNVYTDSDSGVSNPLIVYPDYSYYLYSCLDSTSTRIYAVRIYYTEPVFLPLILKNST